MNKNKKILQHCIISVPFGCLWVFILMLVFVGYKEGILSVIQDAFGTLCVVIFAIFALFIATSVIYLPIFIKKEWIVQLLAYTTTILFCVCGILSISLGECKFSIFSQDLWRDFPSQRITMYDDLEKRYNLNGYTKGEVDALLGQPDSITEQGGYVYDATRGNAIYIEFQDEIVIDNYYIE